MSKKTNTLSVKLITKAGGIGSGNHNRAIKSGGLSVKLASKAGGIGSGNHNRALRA
jgi:hypothetical protein